MNTTTRLLKLCEKKNRCPLGLATWSRHRPDRFGSTMGRVRNPSPASAASSLLIDVGACKRIAGDWDHNQEPRSAMRFLVRLGGFCRPPKQLTRCERRWIGAMA